MNHVVVSTADGLLSTLDTGSVGAIITDPPDRLSLRSTIREVGRVLRPGGALALIGSHQSLRQWDRVARFADLDFMADMVVLWDSGSAAFRPRGIGSTHSRVVWFTRRGLRHTTNLDGPTVASNVLVCKRVPMLDRVHPSEKPVGLTNFLVSLLSKMGDLIVDPFCGSGSTLVSAVQCGRSFIGCDTDEAYVITAQRRVQLADEEYPAPVYLWINGVQHEI